MVRRVIAFGAVSFFALAIAAAPTFAQNNGNNGNNNNGGFNQAIGGISISTEGLIVEASRAEVAKTRDALAGDLAKRKVAAELSSATELRMVSLRAIEAALADADEGTVDDLPPEIRYLAGIQRIQYVFVYPEQGDIVLAGPGEGWRVDASANVVGVTTGRPVVRLEDLLVAFRHVEDAGRGQGISVSIDPNQERLVKLQGFLSSVRAFDSSVLKRAEEIAGPQEISLTGVPTDTRFARVLAAADYRMKRIAMHLEKSPVAKIPSFLTLLKQSRTNPTSMMPRWWMATDYEPIQKSSDGLAFEIRGQGVKCMTENGFLEAGGIRHEGKDPVAQKWADAFTANYEDLCTAEPIFCELRNLMDLSVVAALVKKEALLAEAGCEIPAIEGRVGKMQLTSLPAPKTVPTQASVMKIGRSYAVTASGGVQVASWQAVEKTAVNAEVGKVRGVAANKSEKPSLWWNGQ